MPASIRTWWIGASLVSGCAARVDPELVQAWEPEVVCAQHPCVAQYDARASACCLNTEGVTYEPASDDWDTDGGPWITERAAICVAQAEVDLVSESECRVFPKGAGEEPEWKVSAKVFDECIDEMRHQEALIVMVDALDGEVQGSGSLDVVGLCD